MIYTGTLLCKSDFMNHDNPPVATSRLQPTRSCQFCGMPFVGVKTSGYCSASCRQKAQYGPRKTSPRSISLAQQLKLSRPYDWSNPHLSEESLLLRVLEGADIGDIAKCVNHFSGARLLGLLNKIRDPMTLTISGRKLQNAIAALEPQHAQTRRSTG